MSTDDTNVTPEQKKPKDVHRPPGQLSHADEKSKAPPMVQPIGGKDESERPVVNPVTGGAL
ncbi:MULTISPECIES: hypothetical protein [unclassified Rhizobium]|uniref:hypothetical protein n=1 Tax=unclassified Rhizobium TaxID=2613769 RepID=UPI0007137EA5|nr:MULTISPECIES: hypothetical protein [unclassified Rhizobium]KQS88063.1 hypothetical protein ASG50_09285 [Rhizobium sp. Leaf386]KQU01753.1 hypothetical protein ASG68_07780 [Rhizobium sp. Leaf453]